MLEKRQKCCPIRGAVALPGPMSPAAMTVSKSVWLTVIAESAHLFFRQSSLQSMADVNKILDALH